MDKEKFDCEEYIQSIEMIYFPAEKYNVKEIINNNKESYSAPEISVSQKSSNIENNEGMSIDDAQDLMQSTTTTSSSSTSVSSTSASSSSAASTTASASTTTAASATTTIGATAALTASVATICVATIVGAVDVPGLSLEEKIEPPTVIEEPIDTTIDYGTFKYTNYIVEYSESEDLATIYADITFNFEGELLEDYSCKLIDKETGDTIEVNNQSTTQLHVENKDRIFELVILKGKEIVESQTINFEDYYLCGQNNDSHYIYKSTFNEDNTLNIFACFKAAHEGDFVTYININDYSNDYVTKSDYETLINGNVSSVLNIDSEKFNIEFVTYFIKDNNYYFYYSQKEIIGESGLDCEVSVLDKKVTLQFNQQLQGEVTVNITYEDMSSESFTFNADKIIDNKYEIDINKYSKNPTIEVFAFAAIYDFDPLDEIVDVVGNEYFNVYHQQNVQAVINSVINLTKCEIYNSTYTELFSGVSNDLNAPVLLYFDGYLNTGDTYSVRVYLEKTEIVTMMDLILDKNYIVINDLEKDKEYTFKYYITIDGIESLVGEFTQTLSMIEISDLPSYYCNTPNPGDALVTYNEDGTSNVYLYMNVQDTTYDMYYTVYLVRNSEPPEYYSYTGTDMVAAFNNLPADVYSIRVAVMLNDNGTCYSMYDMEWPSGEIYLGVDEDGNYSEYCGNIYYDTDTKELTINVLGKVTSDLKLTIMTDDAAIELNIPLDEITAEYGSSQAIVDLYSYNFATVSATVEGKAIFQYGKGEDIKSEVEVVGTESCKFTIVLY